MSIPLLFTLSGNRHEIILLDTSSKPTLKALNKQITSTISSSPNCAEFMAKHKSSAPENKETIQEFRIHWDTKTRDTKIWPESTVVTDENFGAVIEMLKLGGGKDVLQVKMGKDE